MGQVGHGLNLLFWPAFCAFRKRWVSRVSSREPRSSRGAEASDLLFRGSDLLRSDIKPALTNQLLRTLPAIAKVENAESTTIIFDMPGPQRDSPETTPMQADVRTQVGQPLGGPPQPHTASTGRKPETNARRAS